MNEEVRTESRYRRPLVVYVVWHPASEQAAELADAIFEHTCQDTSNPLQQGLQIAVRFRSSPGPGEATLPSPIPVDKEDPATASYTAIVVLVDKKMLLDQASWAPYVVSLSQACDKAGSHHRFFPVMVSEKAYLLDAQIAREQFIRIPDSYARETFLNRLAHELCRLVLDRPRAPLGDDAPPAAGPAPVRIFLSHAKRDGEAIAEAFRHYIGKSTQIKSFFDTVDIPSGSKWEDVLDQSSSHLALLAIQTDAYATRPWCQREVLNAKSRNMPVVVLSALDKGEVRSFPYLGNSPSVRWNPDDPHRFETVLGVLLKEVLRNAYFKLRVAALLRLYRIRSKRVVIANYPELLTAVRLSAEGQWRDDYLVIYPDPPLVREELETLTALAPAAQLVTPSMLPSYSEA